MKEKMMRFMAGRNGNDEFNRFLLTVDLILLLISAVFSRGVGRFLTPLVFVLLALTYYRMFSRDLYRRSAENAKYLHKRNQMLARGRVLREQWTQRRDYKFFTCPSCKATLRVPKGRGRIKIVCRKCGNSFTGKS